MDSVSTKVRNKQQYLPFLSCLLHTTIPHTTITNLTPPLVDTLYKPFHPLTPMSLSRRYGRTVCTTIPSWTLYRILTSYHTHTFPPPSPPPLCLPAMGVQSARPSHRGLPITCLYHIILMPLPPALILCICLPAMGVQSARPSHRGLFATGQGELRRSALHPPALLRILLRPAPTTIQTAAARCVS